MLGLSARLGEVSGQLAGMDISEDHAHRAHRRAGWALEAHPGDPSRCRLFPGAVQVKKQDLLVAIWSPRNKWRHNDYELRHSSSQLPCEASHGSWGDSKWHATNRFWRRV